MKKNIKVLTVCTTDRVPHTIRTEMEQVIGLHKAGITVEVLTQANTEYGNVLRREKINVIEDYPQKKVDLKFIGRLRKLLKKNKYDILHAFETKGISNSAFASIGLPLKVIADRGSAGAYWHDPTAYLSVLNPRVNIIVCISDYINRQIGKQLLKKNKTVTVYKGQKLEWFKGVEKSTVLDRKFFWVSCSARYDKIKGVDYFFEAAQYIPEKYPIKFVVFGAKTNEEKAKSKLANCKNSQIISVLGNRDDALNIVAASDISVQPSLSEGLSRSIMESMCLGKPVIATDVGGNPELIQNEVTGLIIPNKNPKEIAKAVIKLYEDKVLYEKVAKNALDKIKTEFSVNKTVENTIVVYENLMDKVRKI